MEIIVLKQIIGRLFGVVLITLAIRPIVRTVKKYKKKEGKKRKGILGLVSYFLDTILDDWNYLMCPWLVILVMGILMTIYGW